MRVAVASEVASLLFVVWMLASVSLRWSDAAAAGTVPAPPPPLLAFYSRECEHMAHQESILRQLPLEESSVRRVCVSDKSPASQLVLRRLLLSTGVSPTSVPVSPFYYNTRDRTWIFGPTTYQNLANCVAGGPHRAIQLPPNMHAVRRTSFSLLDSIGVTGRQAARASCDEQQQRGGSARLALAAAVRQRIGETLSPKRHHGMLREVHDCDIGLLGWARDMTRRCAAMATAVSGAPSHSYFNRDYESRLCSGVLGQRKALHLLDAFSPVVAPATFSLRGGASPPKPNLWASAVEQMKNVSPEDVRRAYAQFAAMDSDQRRAAMERKLHCGLPMPDLNSAQRPTGVGWNGTTSSTAMRSAMLQMLENMPAKQQEAMLGQAKIMGKAMGLPQSQVPKNMTEFVRSLQEMPHQEWSRLRDVVQAFETALPAPRHTPLRTRRTGRRLNSTVPSSSASNFKQAINQARRNRRQGGVSSAKAADVGLVGSDGDDFEDQPEAFSMLMDGSDFALPPLMTPALPGSSQLSGLLVWTQRIQRVVRGLRQARQLLERYGDPWTSFLLWGIVCKLWFF